MNNQEIITECKKVISNGNFEIAINLLYQNFFGKFPDIDSPLILLKSRFHRLEREIIVGIIDHSSQIIEKNIISYAALSLINEIENGLNDNKLVNINNLTKKYSNWDNIVKEEEIEQEQQKNANEAMEEIKKFLLDFIPELKDFSGNFHEKLISQVRDENLFKIATKRVFVFGESNAGKTTTINNLLKSDVFDSELFPASDKFSLTQTLNCGEHEGGLIIYDSPGIGDKATPDNITRAALSIKQKEKKQVDEIIIIDATENKKEGANKFRKLDELEMLKYIDKDAYFKHKDKINGKEFKVADFQNWAKSKFDFFIFVVPCGWTKGLNERQIEFLEDFYNTFGDKQKVFKILNILNDRKQSRYKEKNEELDVDIQFALENSIEEFKNNNFPHPEDWIFVESNFGKGFDKVIESMAKSLSPDTLISIEKSIKSDYSHLIHYKIDEFYFKYISFIASIVGCYPVNFWIEGNTLLSYSIKSIFIVSEYIYQDSKNINPNILDDFIKSIKKARKDYKDASYYKIETIQEPPKYKGTNTWLGDRLNDFFGYSNFEYFHPEEKKTKIEDEKKFYRIGGQFAITATLALGISLYEIYRGKKQYSESEFLAKIKQLHGQIHKDFTPIDIPEKLRKYKHKELRTAKIKEIQPKIEDFAKKYLKTLNKNH